MSFGSGIFNFNINWIMIVHFETLIKYTGNLKILATSEIRLQKHLNKNKHSRFDFQICHFLNRLVAFEVTACMPKCPLLSIESTYFIDKAIKLPFIWRHEWSVRVTKLICRDVCECGVILSLIKTFAS